MSVTVVVLNYNYETYLAQCLQSTIDQELRPTEVILMDDASKIFPKQIVSAFESKFEEANISFRYVENEKNLGTPGNMNKGLGLATGKYLMMLGADNYLHPDYLKDTSHILDTFPGVGVVYTHAAAFGNLALERSGASTWWKSRLHLKERIDGTYPCLWEFFDYNIDQVSLRVRLAKRNFIHGSSLFRRSVWDAGARMKTDLVRAEDWDFWKQAILEQSWGARLVKRPLLYYRHHSNSQRNATR